MYMSVNFKFICISYFREEQSTQTYFGSALYICIRIEVILWLVLVIQYEHALHLHLINQVKGQKLEKVLLAYEQ